MGYTSPAPYIIPISPTSRSTIGVFELGNDATRFLYPPAANGVGLFESLPDSPPPESDNGVCIYALQNSLSSFASPSRDGVGICAELENWSSPPDMRFIGIGVSMSAAVLEVVCGRPRDSAIEEVVVVLVDPEPARSRLCACAGSEKNESPCGSTPPAIFGSSSDIKPNALLNSA
jgi:hypothetical protein